jgi:hypothetical protein
MALRLGSVLVVGSLLAACSVLNAPETLLTTPDEAEGGEGGSGATGGKPSGGMGASAGTSSNDAGAGAMVGVGGCGDECGEGGAPPIGRDCDSSEEDCGSTAPICDAVAGECRACASDEECSSEVMRPYCIASGASAGRCAECKKSTDCSNDTPVCSNAGLCRACNEHAECSSGVCEASGSCANTNNVVYALAETGISGTNCGTIDTPCRNLSVAVGKLTATRNVLVLIQTVGAFDTGNATFPAIKGLRVIGNGITIRPYDGQSAFRVPLGASVLFDNVVIEGAETSDEAAIECTGGAIAVNDSTLQSNSQAILAVDCDVAVTGSVIKNNDQPHVNAQAAIRASCTTESCAKTTTFLRNRFVDNGVAAYVYNQAKVSFENNIFLRNGADGYTRVIELRADLTHFGYNTLVENFNSCTYVGIVACVGDCNNVGNISYRNFPTDTGSECPDQVWYGGTMSYNLTEVAYPGATNKVGDPLFVDAASGDFTPGPGSPAIDGGNPDDHPPFDYNGTKRPGGDAPDMGAIETN